MPGAFLRLVPLPRPDVGPGDYSAMTVTVSPSSPVVIEQFDASGERPLLGFGDGWHEQEFDPRTGRRWRWLSERGELRVTPSRGPLLLHIAGESPRTYFDRGSRLKITADDRVVYDEVLWSDFSRDVRIEGGDALRFETDQTYVPAERSGRTLDRRRLGLKIVTLSVRKAS